MAWNQEFCFAPVQLAMTFRCLGGTTVQTIKYTTLEYTGETSTSHRKFIGANRGKLQNFVGETLAVKIQSQHLKEREEKPGEVT